MKIAVEESFWKNDRDNWFVSLHDEWNGMVIGSGRTRLAALRRAERTLTHALIRVRKMIAKGEAK